MFWSVLATSGLLGVVILGLLAWELRVARRRGRTIATRRWTLSNLGCGVLRSLAVASGQATLVGIYAWVASHVSWTWPIAWWTWLAGFVAIDLAEYLSHRSAHERPVMWAMHVVHHSSPEYNLSLNFRLGVLGPLTGLPFHLMLAAAGLPPAMFVVLAAVQAAGMALTHSRFPGTLGPLGWVLNAPAWHRVHHSAVHAHRDRNYGAIFIIWDRLLGTFNDGDGVPPRWGVDDEPETSNPVMSNVAPWRSLAARVRERGPIALWRW